jgi:NADH:ubiquinone oxidoreductase subunit K
VLPSIGLNHYLVVSAVLFTLGFVCVLTRRNAVALLMGLELILNAANLNFVAFNRYIAPPDAVSGQMVALFGIVLAAAEAAVALAIVLALYQNTRTIDLENLHEAPEFEPEPTA